MANNDSNSGNECERADPRCPLGRRVGKEKGLDPGQRLLHDGEKLAEGLTAVKRLAAGDGQLWGDTVDKPLLIGF